MIAATSERGRPARIFFPNSEVGFGKDAGWGPG
jgi:hypothetical protein